MTTSTNLRNRALGYLARREHSRSELARKLAPHADDVSALKGLLDDLVQRGYLSDARFAAEYVRAKSRRFGAAHLANALREKDVSEDDIRNALASLDEDELARARRVWEGKFSAPPSSFEERGKHMRFLAGRGFSAEVVRKVLRGEDD